MPAAAVKTAPPAKGNPSPKGAQQAPQAQKEEKLSALYNLPKAAGIAIMAALLIVSLFVGNMRALQIASPRPLMSSKEVVSIVEDRAAQAKNAVNIAKRANPSAQAQAAIDSIGELLDDYAQVKDARDLSRADQALTSAVADLTFAMNESLSGEDATMYQKALDNFFEQGSFLRQEARAYNEKANKALALYGKLPTRALLTEPSVYEGI